MNRPHHPRMEWPGCATGACSSRSPRQHTPKQAPHRSAAAAMPCAQTWRGPGAWPSPGHAGGCRELGHAMMHSVPLTIAARSVLMLRCNALVLGDLAVSRAARAIAVGMHFALQASRATISSLLPLFSVLKTWPRPVGAPRAEHVQALQLHFALQASRATISSLLPLFIRVENLAQAGGSSQGKTRTSVTNSDLCSAKGIDGPDLVVAHEPCYESLQMDNCLLALLRSIFYHSTKS